MSLRVSRQYTEALSAGDGELRVTRQYTEVLGVGTGNLRVTRQYVEVLLPATVTYIESVNNTINFSQNLARDPLTFNRSVASTINMTQNAVAGQDYTENVTTTMNLSSVVSRVRERSATSNMVLVQTLLENLVVDDFIPLATAMSLTQQVDVEVNNDQYIDVNTVIAFTQQVSWQGPHYFYINSYLNLTQSATSVYGCPWQPVEFEDDLNLSHKANLTYPLSVNNAMTLTSEMYRRQTPTSTLNLAQSLSWGKTKGLQSTELDLSQTVNVNAIYQRTISNADILGHALTYYIETACGDKQYTPFIGENTINNAPTPPSINEPVIQNDPTTTRFKLLYPALAESTETIELRAPELDNIDRVAFNRISRETRGGKLTVFADPNWPQVQTVIVTFIGLLKTEVDNVLDFFVDHIGEEIGMQDWEGREWVGIVTTPNEPAVQDGKARWTITFEFEGVLIDGFAPGDKMSLVDTVDFEMIYHRSLTHDLNLIQSATYIKV